MKVSITSNVQGTFADMESAIKRIVEQSSPILLAGASSILALVHDRIHGDGLRADGRPLGRYSNSYLAFRIRKHNRTSDPKVIASLTRQMENDFTIVGIGDTVGLGFLNSYNGDKARFIEGLYPGTYYISRREEIKFVESISTYISDLFK